MKNRDIDEMEMIRPNVNVAIAREFLAPARALAKKRGITIGALVQDLLLAEFKAEGIDAPASATAIERDAKKTHLIIQFPGEDRKLTWAPEGALHIATALFDTINDGSTRVLGADARDAEGIRLERRGPGIVLARETGPDTFKATFSIDAAKRFAEDLTTKLTEAMHRAAKRGEL